MASATSAEEATAIAAGYSKGHGTVYYTDCKRLPSVSAPPSQSTKTSVGANASENLVSQTLQCQTSDLMQTGNFSFLPHPEYAGRAGKTTNKPLYLHYLQS